MVGEHRGRSDAAGRNSRSLDGLGTNARFKLPWGIAADIRGNLYVADYGNQTIRKGEFIPLLRLSFSFQNLVLAWPADAAGYLPEIADSLDPAAIWSPLTNSPATNGNSLVLKLEPAAEAAFYRLRQR